MLAQEGGSMSLCKSEENEVYFCPAHEKNCFMNLYTLLKKYKKKSYVFSEHFLIYYITHSLKAHYKFVLVFHFLTQQHNVILMQIMPI